MADDNTTQPRERIKAGGVLLIEAAIAALAASGRIAPWLALGAGILLLFVAYWPSVLRFFKRPKGRKGVANLQVDIPKIMISVDARAKRISHRISQLPSAKNNQEDGLSGVEWSNRTAERIRPVAIGMKNEALGFRADAKALADGLSRWLEIAEIHGRPLGLGEHVPRLIAIAKLTQPGAEIIKTARRPYDELRGLSDSLDVACGELVEALDLIGDASQEMATASTSALLRIKALMENYAAVRKNVAVSSSESDHT